MGHSGRISEFLRALLFAISIIFISGYIVIVLFRIRYPFELEWIEGSMVDQVSRVLSGQKLYVKPTLSFVPYLYPPLYFYLSAVLARIVGLGFVPLRLVSFASSLGSLYLVYLIVRQETSQRFPAMLASGLFAATYRLSGAWFDVARVDSLFLFFLLGSIYLIRFRQSPVSYIFAGISISLSFLTKQTALVMSLPIFLYALYANRRLSVYLIATAVVLIGGSTLLLDRIHDGWYLYYVFRLMLPAQHTLENIYGGNFWGKDLFLPLPIACFVSLLYLAGGMFGRIGKGPFFYFVTSSGLLVGSWVSRLHSGSYDNVLMPAYACVAILFGLGTRLLPTRLPRISMKGQGVFLIAFYALCIAQFAGLYYNPTNQIPTREDEQAGWALIRTLRSIKGDVWLPYHGYLPVLAGKKSFAHGAMSDILGGPEGDIRTELIRETQEAILNKKFSAILVDDSSTFFKGWLQEEDWLAVLDRAGYCLARPVFPSERAFRPVTGGKIRPELMVYPCSEKP